MAQQHVTGKPDVLLEASGLMVKEKRGMNNSVVDLVKNINFILLNRVVMCTSLTSFVRNGSPPLLTISGALNVQYLLQRQASSQSLTSELFQFHSYRNTGSERDMVQW
ncbi:hypothetical protein M758_5G152900 [Ceratodon purpureus]|uniref:Uncharacterized protein n=1 Tax=Ceratodon purpureus TaxID=3225 RepID=A0A8T0I2Z2_CERPU|nr:hypothetical protein KC19_5G159900 [Ceratodon purpureus]KAG0616933.1 hypothetical protein M758_5G152900 [Ceratodon purpureus]